MNKEPSPAIRRAAERAADQPFFLAGVLRAYQAAYHWDDTTLAAFLGCTVEDMPRLALCRRPRATPAEFRADIQHLMARFGLHADNLAHLMREVDALAGIKQRPVQIEGTQHMLRAARDRDDADEYEEPPTEDA